MRQRASIPIFERLFSSQIRNIDQQEFGRCGRSVCLGSARCQEKLITEAFFLGGVLMT
jgi:hypothetical protein